MLMRDHVLPAIHMSTDGTRHRASTSTSWHFAFMLRCHSNKSHAPIAICPILHN